MNIGIENSRRFRALPVYASLISYGRAGFEDMLLRQIELARDIAFRIGKLDFLQLLPQFAHGDGFDPSYIYIVALFRAKDEGLNKQFVQRIKDSRKVYASGTVWDGSPAARFAVSHWHAWAPRDAPVVEAALLDVYDKWRSEQQCL